MLDCHSTYTSKTLHRQQIDAVARNTSTLKNSHQVAESRIKPLAASRHTSYQHHPERRT